MKIFFENNSQTSIASFWKKWGIAVYLKLSVAWWVSVSCFVMSLPSGQTDAVDSSSPCRGSQNMPFWLKEKCWYTPSTCMGRLMVFSSVCFFLDFFISYLGYSDGIGVLRILSII